MSLDQLNASAPLGDVFFDYDRTELSAAARTTLEGDAAWLRKWPTTSIRITGHADERGTAEYNLSLGERRAAVTRDFLAALGVPAARITITSVGKEQPFCIGETEACWSQNRRGHFLVTGK